MPVFDKFLRHFIKDCFVEQKFPDKRFRDSTSFCYVLDHSHFDLSSLISMARMQSAQRKKARKIEKVVTPARDRTGDLLILRSQLVEHSLHCDASPSFMDDCDTVTTTAQDCTESNRY